MEVFKIILIKRPKAGGQWGPRVRSNAAGGKISKNSIVQKEVVDTK